MYVCILHRLCVLCLPFGVFQVFRSFLILFFSVTVVMSLFSGVLLSFDALFYGPFNQATRYASQHICCLSQARIHWEGCARKGIQHKNGGDGRDGGTN